MKQNYWQTKNIIIGLHGITEVIVSFRSLPKPQPVQIMP